MIVMPQRTPTWHLSPSGRASSAGHGYSALSALIYSSFTGKLISRALFWICILSTYNMHCKGTSEGTQERCSTVYSLFLKRALATHQWFDLVSVNIKVTAGCWISVISSGECVECNNII